MLREQISRHCTWRTVRWDWSWTGGKWGRAAGDCDLAAGREGAPALPMVSVVEYRGLYLDLYLAISKFWANGLFLIDEARTGSTVGLAV
jgi:hypothetical protein